MQRVDTQIMLETLLALCKVAIETCGIEGPVKYLLIYIMYILQEAMLYDYTLRHRSRFYFIRADLLFPKEAPYIKVLDTGNDMAYMQLCRMPKTLFDFLLSNMDAVWIAQRDGWTDATRTARRPGRPHMLNGRDVLALTLTWLGTQAAEHHLELLFGVGHSVLDRDLEEGLSELLACLRRLVETNCTWPDVQTKLEFARALEEVRGPCPYPSVKGSLMV